MIYDVLDVCRHIINYSEKEDYGVSNLKLQKLLYFVQAYFMLEKKIMLLAFMKNRSMGFRTCCS